MNEIENITDKNIKDLIHTIRSKQVIIDSDIAYLYEIPTKALNQAVKRNKERFPSDFMFQLNHDEKDKVVTNCDHLSNLKFSPLPPYAFTEQGVAMLSGILRSKKAIEVNIQIIRAFVNMRKFIQYNAEIFNRIDKVEDKLLNHDKKFDKIFKIINQKEILPQKGIFFNGQIFDAYKFILDLLKSAKKSIILIDNYIDDSVLTIFSKLNTNINIKIYTKNISKELKLDIKKYNEQYGNISLIKFDESHDRFLIIDEKEVYHIGASLKDLGKKWFGFSNFNIDAFDIIKKLR